MPLSLSLLLPLLSFYDNNDNVLESSVHWLLLPISHIINGIIAIVIITIINTHTHKPHEPIAHEPISQATPIIMLQRTTQDRRVASRRSNRLVRPGDVTAPTTPNPSPWRPPVCAKEKKKVFVLFAGGGSCFLSSGRVWSLGPLFLSISFLFFFCCCCLFNSVIFVGYSILHSFASVCFRISLVWLW